MRFNSLHSQRIRNHAQAEFRPPADSAVTYSGPRATLSSALGAPPLFPSFCLVILAGHLERYPRHLLMMFTVDTTRCTEMPLSEAGG
jgi:hypothetical protein